MPVCLRVCVCVCVSVHWRMLCWCGRKLKKWLGWMFTSTYWACLLDEQLSFITAACHPLSLRLSPAPLQTLCFFDLSLPFSPFLSPFLSPSLSLPDAPAFLRCLSAIGMELSFCQPSISQSIHWSFAWPNACTPISLRFFLHSPSPHTLLSLMLVC